MTLVTVRTNALGRFLAIVLLLLIAAPFTAPFSTMYGTLATTVPAQDAKDDIGSMAAVAEPAHVLFAPVERLRIIRRESPAPAVAPTHLHTVLRL